jgi:hypothetical protein
VTEDDKELSPANSTHSSQELYSLNIIRIHAGRIKQSTKHISEDLKR